MSPLVDPVLPPPPIGRVRLLHQASYEARWWCMFCEKLGGDWKPMEECPVRLARFYREAISFAERNLASMEQAPKVVEVLVELRKALA